MQCLVGQRVYSKPVTALFLYRLPLDACMACSILQRFFLLFDDSGQHVSMLGIMLRSNRLCATQERIISEWFGRALFYLSKLSFLAEIGSLACTFWLMPVWNPIILSGFISSWTLIYTINMSWNPTITTCIPIQTVIYWISPIGHIILRHKPQNDAITNTLVDASDARPL